MGNVWACSLCSIARRLVAFGASSFSPRRTMIYGKGVPISFWGVSPPLRSSLLYLAPNLRFEKKLTGAQSDGLGVRRRSLHKTRCKVGPHRFLCGASFSLFFSLNEPLSANHFSIWNSFRFFFAVVYTSPQNLCFLKIYYYYLLWYGLSNHNGLAK